MEPPAPPVGAPPVAAPPVAVPPVATPPVAAPPVATPPVAAPVVAPPLGEPHVEPPVATPVVCPFVAVLPPLPGPAPVAFSSSDEHAPIACHAANIKVTPRPNRKLRRIEPSVDKPKTADRRGDLTPPQRSPTRGRAAC